MKFIVTQELFDEMLALMSKAEFSKVMSVIQAVTANPYVEGSSSDTSLENDLENNSN